MVKALSEKSSAWFTYCTSMRPSGLRSTWARLRHLLPVGVTLKRSEGLSRIATRCFAAAQHDTMRQLPLMHMRADESASTGARKDGEPNVINSEKSSRESLLIHPFAGSVAADVNAAVTFFQDLSIFCHAFTNLRD